MAGEITLSVDQSKTKGNAVIRVFDSPAAFDASTPMREESFNLENRSTYTLKKLPEGSYVIILYIDENNNSELDKNFIGIPREPLAFSNNYLPKGPPSYGRAKFDLKENEHLNFSLTPKKVLGDFGRIGLGPALIAKSSPYRGTDDIDLKVIPALSYTGERLQIYGPRIQYGFGTTGTLKFAGILNYRFGAYEEDDSTYLSGMEDREDTLMGGLSIQKTFPSQFRLSLNYSHDLFDRIGGGLASTSLSKGIRWRDYRLRPLLGLNWMSKNLSQHDYAVPETQASETRLAYDLDDTLNPFIGFNFIHEFGNNYLFLLNARLEFLDSAITDSPLINDDYHLNLFSTLNYQF